MLTMSALLSNCTVTYYTWWAPNVCFLWHDHSHAGNWETNIIRTESGHRTWPTKCFKNQPAIHDSTYAEYWAVWEPAQVWRRLWKWRRIGTNVRLISSGIWRYVGQGSEYVTDVGCSDEVPVTQQDKYMDLAQEKTWPLMADYTIHLCGPSFSNLYTCSLYETVPKAWVIKLKILDIRVLFQPSALLPCFDERENHLSRNFHIL